MENIGNKLEICQEDLKLRMKYEGSSNALVDMLKKKKQLKDSLGLGFEIGQCSTSEETSKKDINFVSSSESGQEKTFKFRVDPSKKLDLDTTTKCQKIHVVATRKVDADL